MLDAFPDLGRIYRRAVGQLLPAPRGLGWAVRRRPRPGRLPATALAVDGVRVDRGHLAAYNRVCGFPLRDTLPATYPHVMAFPLAMALLAADDFPFPVVGLVHVANRMEVRRPLSAAASWRFTATTGALRPHRRGRQFDVVVEAADGQGVAWRGVSTYLRREGGGPGADPGVAGPDRSRGGGPGESHGNGPDEPRSPGPGEPHGAGPDERHGAGSEKPHGVGTEEPHGAIVGEQRGSGPREPRSTRPSGPGAAHTRVPESHAAPSPDGAGEDLAAGLPVVARWRVPADLGAAYARVSGDRNPIHTSAIGARLFGFRRPIAHGMWTKARCLAALDSRLPEAYAVDVAFHAPLFLGSTVEFGAAARDGWLVSVTGAGGGRDHLTGRVRAWERTR
ncbi:MAG TPA: MaoC/PaaZ C-terminal domain-containing protein [Pilimelia sp.]|nr:MaoC/PaaZ C-terminal domain-containing protein [Pilimelia sp.]